MTLIMNNLSLGVSLFAIVLSILIVYLKYKAEAIDKENRMKAMEKRRVEMAEAYISGIINENNA